MFLVLLLIAFPKSTFSSKNITITVPDGTSYHRNPDELYLPALWTDIVTFFRAIYLAHAATVRYGPGASWRGTILMAFSYLLFPAVSLTAPMSFLLSCADFEGDDLEKAARVEEWVMVV